MEEPITIPKKKKKLFFFPFAYPIKALHPIEESKFIGVLIILEDISRHSLASVKTGEVLKTFLHDFQAPLTEIQMAIHTSLQEKAGPLTEKQQDVLYAAREKCEELRKLYLELRRISSIAHPQNDQDKQIS